MSPGTFFLLAAVAKIAVVWAIMLAALLPNLVWMERRGAGLIQDRPGPNRVGPFGLFQPVADGIKFLMKEEIFPEEAHRPAFLLAPAMALVPALFAFMVIPFGPTVTVFGHRVALAVLDLDGGILFAFAASSLGVLGIVTAGWASRNKYALMGGLRSSAQMISYELALSLSVIGVLLVSGTLRPMAIVERQGGWFWNWNAFAGGWQFLGFLIFLIACVSDSTTITSTALVKWPHSVSNHCALSLVRLVARCTRTRWGLISGR